MGYPSTVDSGGTVPLALYDGEPGAGSSGAGAANTVYVVAYTLLTPVTLTGVRCRFATGGNGHYDTGIYSDNNGVPGTLLAHAAAANTTLVTVAATVATPALIGGNLALSPGRYWLALWIDNATDTVLKLGANASMAVVMSASSTGPLPTTLTSPANSNFKPVLFGIISGGWS